MPIFRKTFIILNIFCNFQIWAADTCGQFLLSESLLTPVAFGPENLSTDSTEPVLRLEPSGVLTFNPNRYEELKNLLTPFLLSQERVIIETLSESEAKRLKDYMQSQEDFSDSLMFVISENTDLNVLRTQIKRILLNNDQVYFFAVRDQLDWTAFIEIQGQIRFYGNNEVPKMLSPERTASILQSLLFESVEEYMDWARSLERPLNFPIERSIITELLGGALPVNGKQVQDVESVLLGNAASVSGVRASSMMSLEDAISLMRVLKIRNESQFRFWRESGQRPENFPSNPDKHYADRGWISWTHFFGSQILTYEEHEELVRQRGVTTLEAYLELVEKRDYEGRLSRAPNIHFKSKGWVSWNKFFGIPEDGFMSFTEAMLLMKKLGIKTTTQFKQWSSSGQRPKNFPSNPNMYYSKKGWKGWTHFFSNYYLSLEEHIELVRARRVNSTEEYYKLVEKNDFVGRLYKNPDVHFRGEGGWINWDYFFGPQAHYLSLDRLRLAVRRRKITTQQSYERARLNDPQVAKTFPPEPDKFYEGWKGWNNLFNETLLLGECKNSNEICSSSDFFSVSEARLILRLYNIETEEMLSEWLESPKRPQRFPKNPEQYYAGEWVPLGN